MTHHSPAARPARVVAVVLLALAALVACSTGSPPPPEPSPSGKAIPTPTPPAYAPIASRFCEDSELHVVHEDLGFTPDRPSWHDSLLAGPGQHPRHPGSVWTSCRVESLAEDDDGRRRTYRGYVDVYVFGTDAEARELYLDELESQVVWEGETVSEAAIEGWWDDGTRVEIVREVFASTHMIRVGNHLRHGNLYLDVWQVTEAHPDEAERIVSVLDDIVTTLADRAADHVPPA